MAQVEALARVLAPVRQDDVLRQRRVHVRVVDPVRGPASMGAAVVGGVGGVVPAPRASTEIIILSSTRTH
jgi:hypothetical protein